MNGKSCAFHPCEEVEQCCLTSGCVKKLPKEPMAPPPLDVVVTSTMRAWAVELGTKRRTESIKRGCRDKYGAVAVADADGPDLEIQIYGALCEYVVSECLALPRPVGCVMADSVGADYHAPDLPLTRAPGGGVDVRGHTQRWYSLRVRHVDHDERPIVHVYAANSRARSATIYGWAYGREAKSPEWLEDKGGHGPAFWMPKIKQRDICDLKRLVPSWK